MGSRRGRTAATALTIVLVALSLAGCTTNSASGSCVGQEIVLGDSDLRPDGSVQLSSDFFWRTCEDTGGTPTPSDDVTVSITPVVTGTPVLLGRPTPAGDRMTVSGTFDLPADLPSGDAVLRVESHEGERAEAALPVTISEPTSG